MNATNIERNYNYFNAISMVRNTLTNMITNYSDIRFTLTNMLKEEFLTQDDIEITIMNSEDMTNKFIINIPDDRFWTDNGVTYHIYDILNKTMCKFLNNNIIRQFLDQQIPMDTIGYSLMANISQSNDPAEVQAFITSLYNIEITFGGLLFIV